MAFISTRNDTLILSQILDSQCLSGPMPASMCRPDCSSKLAAYAWLLTRAVVQKSRGSQPRVSALRQGS